MTLQQREGTSRSADVWGGADSSGGGMDVVGLIASAAAAIGGVFSRRSRVDELRAVERKYGFYSAEYAAAAKKYPKAAQKRMTRAELRIARGKPTKADLKRLADMARRTPSAVAYPPVIAGPRVTTPGRLTVPQWAKFGARALWRRLGLAGWAYTGYELAKYAFSKLPKAKLPKVPKAKRVTPPRRGGAGITPGIMFPVPPISSTPPPPPPPWLIPTAPGQPSARYPATRTVPGAPVQTLPGPKPTAIPTTATTGSVTPAKAPMTRRQKIEQILSDVGTAVGTYQLLKSVWPSGGGAPRRRPASSTAAFQVPETQPIGLTAFNPVGVSSGTGKCSCGPKKPRRKKKPRAVCYRGTYVETPTGLRKRRGKRVSCQPSRKRRQ